MPYQNIMNVGTRTTTSVNPKWLLGDIDEVIHTLEPNATPIWTILNYIGKGPTPKNHKIEQVEFDTFDNFDFCSAMVEGPANWTRFARLTLDQASRPTMKGKMFYYPQDKLFIVSTGQVVEVVANERADVLIDNAEFVMPTGLTGNSTTRSLAGTVVVRNTSPNDIIAFTTSDIVYLGRTIYESQKIMAESSMRDFVYDMNFVEHKEKVLNMSEDMKKWVKTKGSTPDWNLQEKEVFKEFRQEVESTIMWSEREWNGDNSSRPTHHMRGFYNSIRTNVTAYDPTAITDWEYMFSNFLLEQGFRYNPNGFKKIGLAGARFLFEFNNAFREYRRTSDLSGIGKEIGLDFDTYSMPGGQKISIMRTEMLRQGTPLEWWCFVLEPTLPKLCVVKDFESRLYSNPDERDVKLMVEWQGTVAWHLEQGHALLKTFRG